MALGAGRARVLWQILREGMATALVGIVLGSFGAYCVGRAMQGMVYGVGTIDPVAFTIVALTLLASSLAACLVPGAARGVGRSDGCIARRNRWNASRRSIGSGRVRQVGRVDLLDPRNPLDLRDPPTHST